MKTAEEIWDKHFHELVIAGQIKRNAIPAMVEYADEVLKNNLVKTNFNDSFVLMQELVTWLDSECPPTTMTYDLSHDFADRLRQRLDEIKKINGNGNGM